MRPLLVLLAALLTGSTPAGEQPDVLYYCPADKNYCVVQRDLFFAMVDVISKFIGKGCI